MIAVPAAVNAQGKYPERSIRLVIPFAPGGNTDIMGRRFAFKITPLLGQQVVIDNRAGAGGNIGAAEVARARADGQNDMTKGTAATAAPAPPTPMVVPSRNRRFLVSTAESAAASDIRKASMKRENRRWPACTSACRRFRDRFAKPADYTGFVRCDGSPRRSFLPEKDGKSAACANFAPNWTATLDRRVRPATSII